MIASYLLDSGRPHHELEYLAQNNLGVYPDAKPEEFSESGWKAATRADWMSQLTPRLREKIDADELTRVYSEIELPSTPVIANIEIAGMKVDAEALHTFSDYISKELETLRTRIFAIAGHELISVLRSR
jgi:DNA polymerase-1